MPLTLSYLLARNTRRRSAKGTLPRHALRANSGVGEPPSPQLARCPTTRLVLHAG